MNNLLKIYITDEESIAANVTAKLKDPNQEPYGYLFDELINEQNKEIIERMISEAVYFTLEELGIEVLYD